MENKQKQKYVNLLLCCIAGLVVAVLFFCYSTYRNFPSLRGLILQGSADIDNEEDFVKFINVGQGDCILIRSNGYNAVIDSGNQSDYGSELLDKLRSYGVSVIDCLIITHYDTDHVGGAAKIIGAFDVYNAILPEQDDREPTEFDNLTYALENNITTTHSAKIGTVIRIGECDITILCYNRDAENSNDRSIILMAELKGKKFLLTGDAGSEIEKQMLKDRINVDCDVYKAAHHGSRNSNSIEFITAASPTFSVISAGSANTYGHPHDEVMENLLTVGSKIYRTDRSGDITFRVENGNIEVETEY